MIGKRTASMTAAQRFDLTNAYEGVDENDLPIGSDSMTVIAVMRRVRPALNGLINSVVTHTADALTSGYQLVIRANGTPQFLVRTTAGGVGAGSSVDLDTVKEDIVLICCSYDDAMVRILVNGVANSNASGGGYIVPAAGRELQLGRRSVSNDRALVAYGLVAFLGSDTVALDAAGLVTCEAQLQDDLENGRDLRSALVAGDLVYYDARDLVIGTGLPSVPWVPRVGAGAVTLTKIGNMQLGGYAAGF